jgi:hypothetical protein
LTSNILHGVITQKIELFKTTSVKTSNATNLEILIYLSAKGGLNKGDLNIVFFESYHKTKKNGKKCYSVQLDNGLTDYRQ